MHLRALYTAARLDMASHLCAMYSLITKTWLGLCRLFPNAVGRSKGERQSFVGEQITSYPDASSLSLKRPFDRCPAHAIACILQSIVLLCHETASMLEL